jgi:hypothetical protein
MTIEALSKALVAPKEWEAFDFLLGAKGDWVSCQVWQEWSVFRLANTEFRRVPSPQTDIDPPAEMDAERAEAWLETDPSRVVVDRAGDTWRFNGKHCVCVRTGAGNFADHFGPFRPLVPRTRGQLAEIKRLTKRVNELVDYREQDKRLLASAIGSRNAALAALEQERKESAGLRVCNIRQSEAIDEIRIALENLAEWSEKEWGG